MEVIEAIRSDMNRRDQYDPEMIAYDNAAYLLDQAIALNPAAIDAIVEEFNGPEIVNLVGDIVTAIHLAAPCASYSFEDRLEALLHRLRKALTPTAEKAVRSIA
jgi:hypothetical protein